MKRTPKALLIAAVLVAAVAACSRTDDVTSPGRARLDVQAPLPETTGTTTTQQDTTGDTAPADTTGRYGGSLGSGT